MFDSARSSPSPTRRAESARQRPRSTSARRRRRLAIGCWWIDLDPQGNASTGLGIAVAGRDFTAYDLLFGDDPMAAEICFTMVPGLSVVPSTPDLSSADVDMVLDQRRLHKMQRALAANLSAVQDQDFILIDCPPSLNLLTINALVAADSVLVPLQCERRGALAADADGTDGVPAPIRR